jgi:NDP-4-keto-2,6-dideoxyhexose 3-C-methyltransferase
MQRVEEAAHKLDTIKPYQKFAASVNEQLDKLEDLVTDLKVEGNSICILAASTRGATIWQSAKIDEHLVDYAVERNPAKVGAMFSAIGIPIISEEEFRRLKPEYAIVGPWFFIQDFIDRESEYLKAGGHLIVPLPEVTVI